MLWESITGRETRETLPEKASFELTSFSSWWREEQCIQTESIGKGFGGLILSLSPFFKKRVS